VRAVTTAIGAVAALFRVHGRIVPVELGYRVRDDGGILSLEVTVTSRTTWLADDAAAGLRAPDVRELRRLTGSSFFYDVLTGLVALTMRRYRGRVELEPKGTGGQVVLTLVPSGG
jgi:hypothetical protein